jgi:hypothetical protein
MRSTVVWGIIVAIGVAFVVSACSAPPTDAPSVGLNWDQGTWDSYTWK